MPSGCLVCWGKHRGVESAGIELHEHVAGHRTGANSLDAIVARQLLAQVPPQWGLAPERTDMEAGAPAHGGGKQ